MVDAQGEMCPLQDADFEPVSVGRMPDDAAVSGRFYGLWAVLEDAGLLGFY